MPVRAHRLVRKMRGGAQAHLLEGEDGEFYVVKFINNPQHRRILINEWLACEFLRYLQIHVPQTAQIELTPEFVAANPDLYMAVGSRREQPSPGVHFGSRLAVHPDRVALFDFLPDKLLEKVENRVDFLGMLVFDKWVSNAVSRQAVFFRAKARNWTPLKGNAPARVEPWLAMIENFPPEVVDSALKGIPRQWVLDDDESLERMLETLLKRGRRVPDLIQELKRKRPNAFANWR